MITTGPKSAEIKSWDLERSDLMKRLKQELDELEKIRNDKKLTSSKELAIQSQQTSIR